MLLLGMILMVHLLLFKNDKPFFLFFPEVLMTVHVVHACHYRRHQARAGPGQDCRPRAFSDCITFGSDQFSDLIRDEMTKSMVKSFIHAFVTYRYVKCCFKKN